MAPWSARSSTCGSKSGDSGNDSPVQLYPLWGSRINTPSSLPLPFAQSVWRLAPFKEQINSTSFTSTKIGIVGVKTLIPLPPIGVKVGALAPWILWSIWLSRNNKIFNNRVVSALDTLNLGVVRAREWKEAQLDLPQIPKPGVRSKAKLHPDAVLCHTDGAWNSKHRAGGMGWIFQDKTKRPINQGSKARVPTVWRTPLQNLLSVLS
ncbi:unnamed protein product [Microthlaspi erraticum]|uniref:RNase H type-1 domain-containing protein n=1 Tax=Microthlaspi erraticum TaxID=1685480 RepID=A0A6D2JZ07_9BRAS|nr:unnamed protein product [Microthlaspi erraticum]